MKQQKMKAQLKTASLKLHARKPKRSKKHSRTGWISIELSGIYPAVLSAKELPTADCR